MSVFSKQNIKENASWMSNLRINLENQALKKCFEWFLFFPFFIYELFCHLVGDTCIVGRAGEMLQFEFEFLIEVERTDDEQGRN